jgi:Calx-beta domain
MVSFGSVQAREDAGLLRVPLVRAAGSRGAVALEYTTGDVDFASSSQATAGVDYVASTGRVEWTDGESGLKFVTIPLIDDTLAEPVESFTVRVRVVGGSAILIGSQSTASILSEETSPPPPPPVAAAPSITPGSPVGGTGGGGGSITPPLLLALLAQALARRRRVTSSSGCSGPAGPSCPSCSAAASRAAGRGG